MRVRYKPAFVRQFKKLIPALQQEAYEKIKIFTKDPNTATLRTHKLQGRLQACYSFSVNYKYRIVFAYEDPHTAVLLAVGDHSVYE